MWIEELSERLKESYPDIKVSIGSKSDIRKAKLMLEGQMDFDRNTLYAGNLSSFQNLCKVPDGSNFLLSTENIALPRDILHSCNIISFSSTLSFSEVFNRLQDIILESNRYFDGSASLLECIIKGKELRDIIETGYVILNNPIMLMDVSYKVIAYKTDEVINDPVWSDLVEHGYSSYESVALFKNEKIIEKILRNPEPIILDTGVGEKIRRILGKIMLDGKCAGYLAVLEYNRSFSKQDVKIAGLICDVISSIMNNGNNSKTARGVMFESIILDLLEGKIKDERELSGRLRASEWHTGQNMYAVTIDISKYNDPSFIDYFRDQLHNLLNHSKSVFYNDAILMIIDAGKNGEKDSCFNVLESFLKRNDFHAGVSRKFNDIMNLCRFYKQSQKALELGRLHRDSLRIFRYEDYEISDFILESSRHLDILNFCHPGVLQLKEYDADNNTDYYKTLYEYLKNDKNVILTAGSLYIHRNTVNFRLSKIEELMGLSLRNCKDTLHIFLTYKILETGTLRKGQN